MSAKPERYYHVSQTQLSVARYYGGCTVNGTHYVYDPTTDTLIREDVLKREQAARPKKPRRTKAEPESLYREEPNRAD